MVSARNLLYAGAVAAGALLGALGYDVVAKKTNLLDSSIPVQVRSDSGEIKTLHVPVYNSRKVPEKHCSGYMRRAAQDIFGEEFAISEAWDRIYNDQLVATVGTRSLDELVSEGMLKPGMGVGVYNPQSSCNSRLDMKGKPIAYSHNVLYLGRNPEGEHLFAHQFGEETFIYTSKQLERAHLHPRFIIAAKK